MLIPSILRILDRPQLQTKIVEKAESGFQSELVAAKNRLSALEILDSEIADAAEPVNPSARSASYRKATEELRDVRIASGYHKIREIEAVPRRRLLRVTHIAPGVCPSNRSGPFHYSDRLLAVTVVPQSQACRFHPKFRISGFGISNHSAGYSRITMATAH